MTHLQSGRALLYDLCGFLERPGRLLFTLGSDHLVSDQTWNGLMASANTKVWREQWFPTYSRVAKLFQNWVERGVKAKDYKSGFINALGGGEGHYVGRGMLCGWVIKWVALQKG